MSECIKSEYEFPINQVILCDAKPVLSKQTPEPSETATVVGIVLPMLIFAVAIFLAIQMVLNRRNKEGLCPRCGQELADAGYEGWKKWCPTCGYRNYGNKS